MKKLDRMLGDAIEQTDILRNARALNVLRDWSAIVGDDLAKRCAPDKFERGTLWIAAEGSAWAQEIRMIKGTIMERINQSAHEGLCQEVRVGVRPFKPAQRPPELLAPATYVIAPVEDLSISEIAERRIRKWKDANGA